MTTLPPSTTTVREDSEGHPTVEFHAPTGGANGRDDHHISLGFVYHQNEAMMVVCAPEDCDDNRPIIQRGGFQLVIPREVLIEALRTGWKDDTSGWEWDAVVDAPIDPADGENRREN